MLVRLYRYDDNRYKSGTERDVAARKVSELLIAAVGELIGGASAAARSGEGTRNVYPLGVWGSSRTGLGK